MKKILMSGFIAIAAAAALIITFMVDPYTAKFKKTLDNFHQNFVFVDGYLKDDFSKKIEEKAKELEAKVTSTDQAIKSEKNKARQSELAKQNQPDKDLLKKITDYNQELTNKITELTTVTDQEIMSKLVQDVQKTPADELKAKTLAALPGVKKVIDAASEIEKAVIPELKETYSNKKLSELKALYKDAQTIAGDKLSTLKLMRIVLIIILAIAAGATFIFLEMKSRKSGEIKASEII